MSEQSDAEVSSKLRRAGFEPDDSAQRRFEEVARAAGMDPANPWVGGYAEYEWAHLRLLLESYGLSLSGKNVLEFGSNVGGSAIVLSALGARVTGVDVNAVTIPVAQANLARYGFEDQTRMLLIKDSRTMPLPSASFDFILANSVLEYVDPRHLDAIMAELHRLLHPKGVMFVCGTASRVAPREIHSGQWLVNYVPRWIDRLTERSRQRGLNPFLLARVCRGRFASIPNEGWLKGRTAIHGRHLSIADLLYRVARFLHINPGWISPHIEVLFRKL